MFENIKRYVFFKRATSFTNSNTRERRFVNYEKAKTILLLFESDFSEKNILIRRIIRSLTNDGKKVCSWGYIEKKEITTAILPDFKILYQKDTDFFQKPRITFMNELEDSEFDLVIDLTVNEVIPLEYVLLHANAYCKAGIKKNDLNILDFVIDVDNINDNEEEEPMEINARYIYDQIIFYLKNIQTKD